MTDFQRIKNLFRIDSSNGFSENEIHYLLNIIGMLPQVLFDYYNELGNCDFNYFQDFLIKPNDYSKYENDKYLIICRENQGCCVWGIKKEDLDKINPAVFCSDDLYGFLHGFAYINAVFSLDYVGEDYIEVNQNDINYIKNNFKNKNIRFNTWTDGIEFYGDYDDTIITIMGETSLFYASNNKEHFVEMESRLEKIGIK